MRIETITNINGKQTRVAVEFDRFGSATGPAMLLGVYLLDAPAGFENAPRRERNSWKLWNYIDELTDTDAAILESQCDRFNHVLQCVA